ncbi:MAG: M28 family peptidase [Woeseiaceae bacterium]|nr:M28 family peptidase [Woeseiaceae bacterium]
MQTSWTGEQFELPAGDEPRAEIEAWVTEESARELFELAGHDLDALRVAAENRDFEPVPLGIRTSIGMDVSLTRASTANVLGLIPGGDPELADEAVIYTAHHDHLGIGTPDDTGDTIYNGAMDNASGVAQVLAIAKAIKALPQPPRRFISSPSSAPRNRACWAPCITRRTRRFRRAGLPPTSTTMAATSGVIRTT